MTVIDTMTLACETCGRLPHPRKTRLTIAKLAAVFPLELALHATVILLHPHYLVSVTAMAVSATLLVVWIIEPAAMKILRSWLHAPAMVAHGQAEAAPALWRLRAVIPDRPGALDRLTHELAQQGANILSVRVHPLAEGVLDEFVLASSVQFTPDSLIAGAERAGARRAHVWPTTALALADGQTRALTLATRVVAEPLELGLAAAELLGAQLTPAQARITRSGGAGRSTRRRSSSCRLLGGPVASVSTGRSLYPGRTRPSGSTGRAL
jgi:hypothetical protein